MPLWKEAGSREQRRATGSGVTDGRYTCEAAKTKGTASWDVTPSRELAAW